MNKRFGMAAWCMCLALAASFGTVWPVQADEQSDLLLDLEQRLQKSGGEKKVIDQIASEVIERRVDVATLIVLYAGRNLMRVATETGQPPVTVDLTGKKLPFDPQVKDAGVSQIAIILITALAPRSEFRQEVAKFISQAGKTAAQVERMAKIAELLARTVANYAMSSLLERLKARQTTWPFPLCLPRCDG